MRNLDSYRCWRCTLCPCKVRNKLLVNFWNRTIPLCIPCISYRGSRWNFTCCHYKDHFSWLWFRQLPPFEGTYFLHLAAISILPLPRTIWLTLRAGCKRQSVGEFWSSQSDVVLDSHFLGCFAILTSSCLLFERSQCLHIFMVKRSTQKENLNSFPRFTHQRIINSTSFLPHFRLSWRLWNRFQSSKIWPTVDLYVVTNVSEKRVASKKDSVISTKLHFRLLQYLP